MLHADVSDALAARARRSSTGSRDAGRGRRPPARPRTAARSGPTPSLNERSVSSLRRSPMWWPTQARLPLARQNVFFSSAPQASSVARRRRAAPAPRARSRASGAAAAGCPPTARTTESSVRVLDRAVVDEEVVGDAAPGARARRRRGRRSARRRRCRWSSPASWPASREQQVVQRRVGQHHAELGAARRDRRRHGARRRAAAPARSGARARTAGVSASPELDERRGRLDVGRHQRERPVLAVLARAQPRHRGLVVGAAGEVVAAEALDRDDRAVEQQRRGRDASRRRPTASPSRTAGPQSGQALGCAWKRRSPGSSYSAWQRCAHGEAGHRRQRPVVGHAAHDREARAAVGAVDERVAIAAVGGVEELGQAVVAGRGVGRRPARPRSPPAGLSRIRNPRSPVGRQRRPRHRLDRRQRRRLGRQPRDEPRRPRRGRPRPRAARRARR